MDLLEGEPDPRRRLALITTATTAGKTRLRSLGGDVTDILRVALPVARAVVRSWMASNFHPMRRPTPVVRWGHRLGSIRVNLSVSNVPGPTAPLWLGGARMRPA